MADADFSGVLNPKQALARREAQAEGATPAASAASAPSGMSQSDFGRGRKLTPAEEAVKQKKLAAKLRQHRPEFEASGY